MKPGITEDGIMKRGRRAAYTLIEVMTTLVIISILFGGVLAAYERVLDAFIDADMHERAMTVAQRQMERLIASRQEPNSVDLMGVDELDPDFEWEMTLKREPLPGAKPPVSLPQTVIVATVTVTQVNQRDLAYEDEEEVNTEGVETKKVELVRYFPWLTPRLGETIAVPLGPEVFEEPAWLIELRQELGREPTLDEIIRKLGLPMPEELEEMESEIPEESDEKEPLQPD
ncbi:MAG: type II secretion system protein [Sedimentisphaerales bacterium]|nr:type II secretion system protein [Sedimentisphaerales bacterium]